MGEAFLIKALNFEPYDPLDDVEVVASHCSILCTIKDSGGNKLSNIPINCKDGNTWYNYTSNEGGMVLFMTNSGSANIIARNYSSIDKYNMADQDDQPLINIDAPVGTKKSVELSFNHSSSTIYGSVTNIRFMDTSVIPTVKIVGGGASGNSIKGGGGGAYNQQNNVSVDRASIYTFIIGNGGYADSSWMNNTGNSGGTTSIFNISAIGGSINAGGGFGTYKGGNGGEQNKNGSPPNYGSLIGIAACGGGGGGGIYTEYKNTRLYYNNLNSSWVYSNYAVVNVVGANGGGSIIYRRSSVIIQSSWTASVDDYPYGGSGGGYGAGGCGGTQGSYFYGQAGSGSSGVVVFNYS